MISGLLKSLLKGPTLVDQVRLMLNDPDPEEYLETLRTAADPRDPLAGRRLAALEQILKKARDDHLALGVDPGEHASLENAYLFRQRYVESVCQKLEVRRTMIMLAALVAAGLILMLSAMLL